ncbi:MAG TPA: chitobiase/beta-hexosaminidase C-terminal domain-containing protein [Candidatus Blautia intestinigallinarum]|nr:chitobiase/beta-hexosaminidase C-terminal domain-containing protein [Candidatus Blautia intestinigallinarum]
MKCPHCGKEVKPGTLFCPKCLTEIQWVPEYNTVETLIRQKEKERDHTKKTETKTKKLFVIGKKWKKIFLCGILMLLLLVLALVGLNFYQANSYVYQYKTGVRALEQGDYQKALEHIDAALVLEPDNPNANLMLASIFEAQKDYSSVEKILTVFLKQHPDNREAYSLLLKSMEKNGDLEEIRDFMKQCTNPDILDEFSEYICPDPVTNLKSGTYREEKASITLEGDCEKIYYSFDGTKPDENSSVYSGPIQIKKGVTILYAYGVNEKGIPSDVIYRKYVLKPEEDE